MLTALGVMLAAWGVFIYAVPSGSTGLPGLFLTSIESVACLFLAGIALVATGREQRVWRRLTVALGAVILLIAAFAILRFVFQVSLPPAPESVAIAGSSRRMSLPAALGMLIVGLLLLLLQRRGHQRQTMAMQLLWLLLFGIALLGALGHLSNFLLGFTAFDFGVSRYDLSRGSTLGLVLLCAGLFLAARMQPWFQDYYGNRPDRLVFALSFTILLTTATAAAIGGSAVFAQQSMRNFQETLRHSLQTNERLFLGAIEAKEHDAELFVRFSRLGEMAVNARLTPPQRLQKLNEELRLVAARTGLPATAAINVVAGDATVLASYGRWRPAGPGVAIAGDASRMVEWNGGFWLRLTLPIDGSGHRRETVRFLLPLTEFNEHLDWGRSLGLSGDVRICARVSDTFMECFEPQGKESVSRRPRQAHGQTLAMSYALDGLSGVGLFRDFRGVPIVGAYKPVGNTRLGMVQKIDLADFTTAMRHSTWLALLIIVLLVLAAASLLYYRMHPTMRRLVLQEEALRHSEYVLAEAQRIAHLGSWEWEIATDRQYWSDETFRIFGLEPQSAMPSYRLFMDIALAEDHACIAENIRRALSSASHYVCHFRVRHPDGELRQVLGQAEVIRGADGKPLKMIGVNLDITDRVETEARLQKLRSLYAMLSRANQAIVRIQNLECLLEEICRIAVEEGGLVMAWAGRIAGEQVISYAHWGREDGYLDEARIVVRDRALGAGPTGKAVREGRHFVCDDIANDPLMAPWRELALARGYRSSAAFPVRVGSEVVGSINFYAPASRYFTAEVISLLDDLTEDVSFAMNAHAEAERRRRAEDELSQLNLQLEQRVRERTQQLGAANKELEAFSYSVSHDLRAPLRAVDGFSQVLLKRYAEQLDDAGRDYLGRVRRASQRMGELIDDLLHLSRVSRGTLRHQEVDLTALAQSLIEDMRRASPERKVDCRVQEGMRAFGDPGLLRAVLDNLLGNAWKFTRKTDAAVIEFGCREEGDGLVYFVRDNGAGFDHAYAKKLFQVFQRLHSEAEFEGTGIGLATVQRIIQRHHGAAWAEGETGKGATFYFTLPQRQDAGDDVSPTAEGSGQKISA